jgi:hydrogenase maturation protease
MREAMVVGIGNPYRSDDAAGWAVIDAIKDKAGPNLKCSKSRGDLAELLELFAKHPCVYLVDACLAPDSEKPWLRIDASRHEVALDAAQSSTHGLGVSQAIALAKNLGQMPLKLIIYALPGTNFTLGNTLSPAMRQTIAEVAEAILKEEDTQHMHEKGIMDGLMKKIFELAKAEKAMKVTKVSVKLGALSQMSAEHFKEHFDAEAKGTIAEDAELDAEESQDAFDPDAHHILLKSIDVDTSFVR